MTNQQVFELWNEITKYDRQGNPLMYKFADEFISGKTNTLKLSPRQADLRIPDYYYPERLVAELDGNGAETAKRALLVFTQIISKGIVNNINDIKTARRIGYSLSDCIMSIQTSYWTTGEDSFAKELYRVYPEQAEKLITPDNVKKIAEGKIVDLPGSLTALTVQKSPDDVKFIILMMARLKIIDGTGDTEKLKDIIAKYAVNLYHPQCAAVVCGIFEDHSGLTEALKKAVSEPGGAEYYTSYYRNCNRRELFDKLGMYEDYLYLVLCRDADKKFYKTAVNEAAGDGELLMRFIERAENTDKSKANPAYYLAKLACPVAMRLKNGEGKKELERLEMHFGEMIGGLNVIDLIVGDFNMKTSYRPELFIPAVYDDPAKASKMIVYTNRLDVFSYIQEAFISAFAVLFEYSDKARAIYTALFLASKEEIEYGCFIYNFALARNAAFGEAAGESDEKLYEAGLPITSIFTGIVSCNERYYYSYSGSDHWLFFKNHISEAVEYWTSINDNAKRAAWLAEIMVKKAGYTDPSFMTALFTHKSKVIQKMATEEMVLNEEKFRPELEKVLPKLKGDAKTRSEALLKRWENARKYGKDFNFPDNDIMEEFVRENYGKAHEKEVFFIPDELLADVRYADLSGRADPVVIKYIIGEYMSRQAPEVIPVCGKVAARLHMPDLQDCLENIYRDWIDSGADTKKKMILVPYCVFASDGKIIAMKKQIQTWTEAARGALASFAVTAMAINGGSPALMTVNDIAAKFPNNMVKKAAKGAFAYAAKSFGVTEDVLADRIVPTLGFDDKGQQVLDYGARQFTVTLMPDLSLTIFDNEKGKAVKSLPKPGANDDEAKAEIAKKNFSELKKQIKAVVSSQKSRMETVFRNGRTWDKAAWDELFGKNPIMNILARSLVWGVYDEKDSLISTFRYADDGTLCDENDDIFELPENARISLVHPVEMTEESIASWTEQLADYEIVQPFPQITARVITLEDGDVGEDFKVTKYEKRSFTFGSMTGAAKKYCLVRSSVEDAGGFSGYHIQDRTTGVGMAINGDNMYMGMEYNENVDLTDVYFYTLPEEDEKPDSYSEYQPIDPKTVKPRFVSCALNILENILD